MHDRHPLPEAPRRLPKVAGVPKPADVATVVASARVRLTEVERQRRLRRVRRRAGLLSASGWGGFGFVLGALVAHAIGFWSFVSDVVLKGPDDERRAADDQRPGRDARTASPLRIANPGLRGTVQSDPAACTALILDRATGATTATTCLTGPFAGSSSRAAARGDRLASRVADRPLVATEAPATGLTGWAATSSQR